MSGTSIQEVLAAANSRVGATSNRNATSRRSHRQVREQPQESPDTTGPFVVVLWSYGRYGRTVSRNHETYADAEKKAARLHRDRYGADLPRNYDHYLPIEVSVFEQKYGSLP